MDAENTIISYFCPIFFRKYKCATQPLLRLILQLATIKKFKKEFVKKLLDFSHGTMQFDKEVLSTWNKPIPIAAANLTIPPDGWKLKQALFGTPTIVLFRNQQEVARYTGYQGADKFWHWLLENTK